MIYLVIEDNKLTSVCDYKPNIDKETSKLIAYSGNIPKERIIYVDGKVKDSDNYLFVDGKYVPKTNTLENQINDNLTYKRYLSQTDWLVIRHRDQLAIGGETSLTNEEYLDLLIQRQEARKKVVDIDGQTTV